ncbi:ABC transporter permease, partial [Micromonospora aurantiaca]|nr:ABC transporter permease [Micromonospora aurantiaca]
MLAAKLLAHGVAGAAYGLVLAGTAAGAFFGASAVRGVTLGLPAADITGILARIALAMVAYMLLGIGMGALIRNQAAALVVVIGYLYAGEMTLLV